MNTFMQQITDSWARFIQYNGETLSEVCTPAKTCGTQATIWMNDTHPVGMIIYLMYKMGTSEVSNNVVYNMSMLCTISNKIESWLYAICALISFQNTLEKNITVRLSFSSNCNMHSRPAKVRRCQGENGAQDYFVYKLANFNLGCSSAYCAGDQLPCPRDSIWNDTLSSCACTYLKFHA